MTPVLAAALAWALAGAGALIGLISAALVARHLAPDRRRLAAAGIGRLSVTLLKPLHGASPTLAADLASFLAQDFATPIWMLCGVASADDPAAQAVASLPAGRAELVITGEPAGRNRKVGNLIGLAASARTETLIISDADIAAPRDYLRVVTQALAELGVGAVTCLYTGAGLEAGAPGAVWSRLAAMDIDYRFLPNAVLGTAIGLAAPCFGSTIALRRETLAAIGGFAAFEDVLADDYEIGRAVRALGLGIAIPPLTVVHHCGERSLRDLIAHELRWARTIRRIDPAGHAGGLLTHALPLALIGCGFAAIAGAPPPWIFAPPLAVWAGRWIAKTTIDKATGANAGPWWLLPARDVLSFAIFLASFAGDTVTWGGRRYRVRRDGVLSELQRPIFPRP